MTAAVITVVAALILGLVANAFVLPRVMKFTEEKQGHDSFFVHPLPASVCGPATTLLGLFLAFVLVGVSGSYGQAKTAVQAEAAVVDNFFETAEYLPDPSRRRLQRAAVCYARAVAGPEWDAMATGEQSKVPNNWTGTGQYGVRRVFLQLGPENALFRSLTAADQKRGDARRDRLTQARPKIPGIVFAFLLIGIGTTLFYFAFISPRRSPVHISASVIAGLTLFAALFVILNLDRPFSGALRIAPTEIQTTAGDVSADFIDRYGKNSLPCDKNGNPARRATS